MPRTTHLLAGKYFDLLHGAMHAAKDSAPRRIPFTTVPNLDLPDTGGMGAFKQDPLKLKQA